MHIVCIYMAGSGLVGALDAWKLRTQAWLAAREEEGVPVDELVSFLRAAFSQ